MMSPLKLSVIVCGAAAGLAVAPYVVKQILPPQPDQAVVVSTSSAAAQDQPAPTKIDLPVAGPTTATPAPAAQPVVAIAAPAKEVASPSPELHLAAAPALPSPAPVVAPEVLESIPSLNSPSTVVASAAMPAPLATSTPAPPRPSPTPEIPYRSDVEAAQKLMKQLGLSTGKIDGKLGPNTQAALRSFQGKNGLDANGEVTPEVIAGLEKAIAALPTPTPSPAPTPEPKVTVTEVAAPSDDMKISSADDPGAIIVRPSTSESPAKPESPKPAAKPEVASAPTEDPGPVPTLKNQVDVKKLQAKLLEAGTYQGAVDGRWGDLTRSAMRAFQEKAGIDVTGKPNKETWLAMHSGKVQPESKSVEIAEKPESTPTKKPAEKPAEEVASLSEGSTGDHVVTLNGDGRTKPEAAEPMATPKAVSSIASSTDEEKPSVKVAVPDRTSSDKSDSKADDKPNDLAMAKEDRESQAAALKKEIEATRASIKSVSNDSNLEVKKYAPSVMDTVNTMADGLNSSNDDNPEETRETIQRIRQELEKAKEESRKNKADSLVSEVRKSYTALKDTFPDRIKSLSLSDDEQKKQREELTVFVATIDKGYDAMESDFKKGKYDPIFKNGVPFRNTIDEINRGLAEIYVKDKIEDKSTKGQLAKDDLKKVDELMKKDEPVKAAETLDKAISSSSKKKS